MTLEEAIKHLEETLADPGHDWGCEECKAEHEQLLEWLRELQQWRRVYGVCPSYEMCIPECKEGYNAQIAEYKRLLKSEENIKLRDTLETACTALEKVHKCGGISCEACNAAVGFCPHDNNWYLPFMSKAENLINGEGKLT